MDDGSASQAMQEADAACGIMTWRHARGTMHRRRGCAPIAGGDGASVGAGRGDSDACSSTAAPASRACPLAGRSARLARGGASLTSND